MEGTLVETKDQALILPDKILAQVSAVLAIVKENEITTDAEFEKSGGALELIAEARKGVKGYLDPEVNLRNRKHKESTAARGEYLKPLTEAEDTWREKIGAYRKIINARVAAEQAAADEKARKEAEDAKVNLAAELEKGGHVAEATAVIEDNTEPVIMSPKIEAPKAAGVNAGEVWTGELVSLKDLVFGIAAGTSPLSLLKLDSKGEKIPIQSNIKAFAKSTEGAIKVAGVRFYQEDKIGRTGRR